MGNYENFNKGKLFKQLNEFLIWVNTKKTEKIIKFPNIFLIIQRILF